MTGPAFTSPDGVELPGLPEPSPCPFCGNDGTGIAGLWMCSSLDATDTVRWEVHCVRCHCIGPGAGEFSPMMAAARWNHRGSRDYIPALRRALGPAGRLQ